jgi:hypothetical protein
VTNIDEENWSHREHECWSINVAISVSINVKGGDCWIVGLDSWLSLM